MNLLSLASVGFAGKRSLMLFEVEIEMIMSCSSGLLCISQVVPYKRLHFPKVLHTISSNYLYPLLKSESVNVRPGRANRVNRPNVAPPARGYQVDRLIGGEGGGK